MEDSEVIRYRKIGRKMAYRICGTRNIPVNREKAQDFADMAIALSIKKYTPEKAAGCSFESFLFWEVFGLITRSVRDYLTLKRQRPPMTYSEIELKKIRCGRDFERDLIIRDILEKTYQELSGKNRATMLMLSRGLSLAQIAKKWGVSHSMASQRRSFISKMVA